MVNWKFWEKEISLEDLLVKHKEALKAKDLAWDIYSKISSTNEPYSYTVAQLNYRECEKKIERLASELTKTARKHHG